MSKIGKFLNLKGFHPSNFRNQERVWQKENEQKKRRKLEDEREKELKKEADMQAYNRLQKQMGLKDDSLKDSVRFMYQAPQGADQAGGGNDSEDDAVKAFKRRMAERQGEKQQGQGPAPGEEGARGRGGGGGGEAAAAAAGGAGGEGLKYGPGELTTGEVSATYKGVGKEQKAGAQCLRCKAYGHHSGDRDCPLRGDAAAADAERRLREDPLTHIAAQVHRATAEGVSTEGPGGRRRQLVLRERALPRELAAASGIYSAGGAGIVLSSDDDAAAGEEEEGGERALGGGGGGGGIGGPRFDVAGLDLGSLSQAEKRLLLKKIRRMEAGEEGAPSSSSSSSEEEGGGKKKRRKKDKKKKKSKKAKEEKKKKKKTKKKKKKKEHL